MSYDFDNSGTTRLSVATPIAALPLTIAAWFKVEGDGNGNAIVCLGNASNSEIFRLAAAMDIASDPIRFRATNAGGTNHDFGGGTISLNTWYHAAIVVSGTGQAQRAVFLNGTKYTSAGANTRDISSATILSIGAQYQAGTYGVDIDGKIAHVAVWDVALTDGNITSLAGGANPMTISASDLVSYWPLTADLVDLIASLTLTNSGGASLSGDNPTVDPAPGSDVSVGFSNGEQTQSAETVSINVDGLVSFQNGEQAQDAQTVGVTVPALTLLPDDQDADNYDTSLSTLSGTVFTMWLKDSEAGVTRAVSGKARLFVPAGVDLTFRIDLNSKQTQGPPTGNNNTTGVPWAHTWRDITGGVFDMDAWSKVDSYSYVGGSTRIASGMVPNAATDRIIEVGLKPTVRASEVLAMYDDFAAGPYAYEPPSVVAARIADPTLAPFRHARLTTGASKNSAPSSVPFEYPAVRIGSGPRSAQWLSDQHAREDGARYAFRVAKRRLAYQAGGRYDAFRARFTLDSYAVNLNGNYGGAERFSCESNGTRDTNRQWHTTTSPQVNAVRSAMAVDRGGRPLANMSDWHGLQDSHVIDAWCDIYTTPEFPAELEFANRVIAIIGAGVIQEPTALGSAPYDTAAAWSGATIGSPLGLTIEFADAAPGYPDAETMYGPLADAIIDVLNAMADEGWFGSFVEFESGEQTQSAETVDFSLAVANVAFADGEQAQSAETVAIGVAVALALAHGEQLQDAETVDVATGAGLVGFTHGEQTQSAETVAVGIAPVVVALAHGEQTQDAETVAISGAGVNLSLAHGEQTQSAETVGVGAGPASVAFAHGEQVQTATFLGVLVVGPAPPRPPFSRRMTAQPYNRRFAA